MKIDLKRINVNNFDVFICDYWYDSTYLRFFMVASKFQKENMVENRHVVDFITFLFTSQNSGDKNLPIFTLFIYFFLISYNKNVTI